MNIKTCIQSYWKEKTGEMRQRANTSDKVNIKQKMPTDDTFACMMRSCLHNGCALLMNTPADSIWNTGVYCANYRVNSDLFCVHWLWAIVITTHSKYSTTIA